MSAATVSETVDRREAPHLPASPSAAQRRLEYLFRRSLGSGDVHPLLHVLKRHFDVQSGLDVAAVTAPRAAAAGPSEPVSLAAVHQRVATLPSLPQAVQEAIAALNSEGASAGSVAERIERDQSLTARTLRAANTAFYGAPGRVATIRTAISVLGLRTVSALLTTASISAQFTASPKCPEFRFPAFWRHTLTTALVARGLARRVGMDEDVAFTAGLLHDIGALVLATQFPAEAGAAWRFAIRHDLPLAAAERAVLGLDHCAAGEALARHWRIPDEVVCALAAHHEPSADDAPDGPPTLGELVHVADALAHGIQPAAELDDVVPPVAVHTWTRLGLTLPACLAVLEASAAGVEALCEALSL